jgi:hypothetical protein
MDCGLDNATCGLGDSVQVISEDSASTEETSVSEVLSSQVANGKLGKNNLGS